VTPAGRLAIALCVLGAWGCPPSAASIDAGLDASLDALTLGDTLSLDAPRRSDAGYDSGAQCALDGSADAGAITSCNGHPELCDRRFDEVAVLTAISEQGATLMDGVPTAYYDLLAHPDFER